jgi:hypothetical protein
MSISINGSGEPAAKAAAAAVKWDAIRRSLQYLGTLAFIAFIVHTCAGQP